MAAYDYTVQQFRQHLLHLAKGDQGDGARDDHHEGIQGVPEETCRAFFRESRVVRPGALVE